MRSLSKCLIAFLLAAVITCFFIPQILSTSVGKPLFERALGKKFDAEVSIESVHLNWLGPQKIQGVKFSRPDLSGSIETLESNVPIWSLSQFGNAFRARKGIFSFPKYNRLTVGPVNATISNRDVHIEGSASQGGHFAINGKIYSKTDFDIVANVNNMPSIPVDQILGAGGILSASVGPVFGLSSMIVYHQGEGKLQIEFSSPNTDLDLQAEIAQDTLVLKEPLNAVLRFSPELSAALKGCIVGAKNPITFRIETTGRNVVPLHPFAIHRLEIEQATLDLGQLVMTHLHPLISLFALLNSAPIASSTAPIWFTPAALSLTQGVLSIGRVDVLIGNTVHLCAWGQIELSDGRLNMKVGIPADTLQQTLGIKNLSRNYVLQIPVRGTIKQPVYDTTSAAAKIAALVTGQQIANKKMGALQNLLNTLTQIKQDEDAPPPNRPFPWESTGQPTGSAYE